jgi:inosose dehydratase
MIDRARVALNPLQLAATADGWFDFARMPPIDVVLEQVAAAGFRAAHTSPAPDTSPDQYARRLAAHGLQAGPGYLALPWSDAAATRDAAVERLRLEAARLRDCGATSVFVALDVDLAGVRFRSPAVGRLASRDRLDAIGAALDRLAEGVREFGLVPALHQHIGTWIETEDELRGVLDAAPSLAFGPDLGHLAWARADITALTRDYAERIGGVHLKDLRTAVLDHALADGLDYPATVRAGLWAEPGFGDAPLGPQLDGLIGAETWIVVEVDHAATADPFESIRRCGRWLDQATRVSDQPSGSSSNPENASSATPSGS